MNTDRHEEILASLGDEEVPALVQFRDGSRRSAFVTPEMCYPFNWADGYHWGTQAIQGARIVHLLAPDEWVEFPRGVDMPRGARVREEWLAGQSETGHRLIHRDDLPKPVDERVEVVLEVLGETEHAHHDEVTRQILAALDAMGGAK